MWRRARSRLLPREPPPHARNNLAHDHPATRLQYECLDAKVAYTGLPPSYVDIVAVVAAPNTSVDRAFLSEVVECLKDGDDDDCIFFPTWSVLQAPQTAAERTAAKIASRGERKMHSFYRVRVVVMPLQVVRIAEHAESMAKLILSSYCQRIINAKDARLGHVLQPTRLVDLQGSLAKLAGGQSLFIKQLARRLKDVQPILLDRHGFEVICKEVQIQWVKVGYIKKLAKTSGPFPRQQDLHPDAVHVGLPPGRKFSLSHGWFTEMHPDPSGSKMARLAATLIELDADDELDGVFIDYCSLPQKAFEKIPEAYFKATGAPKPMQDRTPTQKIQFNIAMWEMTRLYAFSECDVIVDPIIGSPDDFPSDSVTNAPASFDPGKCEWGWINSRPYSERGWCCAEFAVAMKNGRIVNKSDAEVRKVLKIRKWPKDVHEYAAMMEEGAEPPVRFTNKGDIAAVLYNFYKMTGSVQVGRGGGSLVEFIGARLLGKAI